MRDLWNLDNFKAEDKNCQLNMILDVQIPIHDLESFYGDQSKWLFIIAEIKFTYDKDLIGFQT